MTPSTPGTSRSILDLPRRLWQRATGRGRDQRRIQGLWRLSRVLSRVPSGVGHTHLLFAGDLQREVDPESIHYDDEGWVETRFELFPREKPARMEDEKAPLACHSRFPPGSKKSPSSPGQAPCTTH